MFVIELVDIDSVDFFGIFFCDELSQLVKWWLSDILGMLYKFTSIIFPHVFFSLYLFIFSKLQLLNIKKLLEDVPDEFATLILNFISRNSIGPHGDEVCIFVSKDDCKLFG